MCIPGCQHQHVAWYVYLAVTDCCTWWWCLRQMGCRWSVSAIPGATQSGQGPGVTGRCMLWLQSLSSTRYARSSKLLFPCFLLILFWLQPLSSTRHAQSPKLLFPCFLLILFWLQSLSSTRYARSSKLLFPCFLLILFWLQSVSYTHLTLPTRRTV